MTRKDYQRLANALREAHNDIDDNGSDGDALYALATTGNYIADALAADNPRFDRERFLAACRRQSDE